MSKIRNVNKSTRTLNSYQFGWLMRELQLDFSTRHFLCGEGPVFWQGWQIGKAQQLDGGDWRVEVEGSTERSRTLMNQFTRTRLY